MSHDGEFQKLPKDTKNICKTKQHYSDLKISLWEQSMNAVSKKRLELEPFWGSCLGKDSFAQTDKQPFTQVVKTHSHIGETAH